MNPEHDDIHALLQLKKHEQPPPGYFDDFLAEFQRRQREEMLRRSVWQIAWDRLQAFFETDRAGAFGYAAATAAVFVLGAMGALKIVSPHAPAPARAVAIASTPSHSESASLTLDMRPQFASAPQPLFTARQQTQSGMPHYVIDARPVSYEPAFSF